MNEIITNFLIKTAKDVAWTVVEESVKWAANEGQKYVSKKISKRSDNSTTTTPSYNAPSSNHKVQTNVGDYYSSEEHKIKKGLKAFDKGHYDTAYQLLSKIEYLSDVEPIYCLAFMIDKGLGCEADINKAMTFYHKAASLGDMNAQYRLGSIYLGEGDIKENPTKSYLNFLKAAKQGHAASQCLVGYMFEQGDGVEKSIKNAKKWYKKAAGQEVSFAQVRLGYIYLESNEYQTAFEFINAAVAQNNSEALNQLGCCYAVGLGVEVDKSKAMDLLLKAAEGGNSTAMSNIGEYYEEDEQNYQLAMEWYQKAIDNGSETAVEGLEHCKQLLIEASKSSDIQPQLGSALKNKFCD